MYHLRAVTKEGYVQKVPGGYQLTAAGKRYVDRISMEKFQPRIQPKIVSMLVITNKKGELLLWQRNKQPFIGKMSFPVGKIHLGESLDDAAERELSEKTGLHTKLNHVGDGYITIYEGTELVSQVMFHCFTGTSASDAFIGEGLQWSSLSAHQKALAPGVEEVYAAVKKNKTHFFVEITK